MIKGKKIAVVLMTATLSIAMLAGCGSKKFDLEKYGEKAVVTVDGESVSFWDANFQARLLQTQYESMYGTDIWTQKLQGEDTFETSMKSVLLDGLKINQATLNHAKDYKVELTEEEKKSIEEQADLFLEQVTDEFKALTNPDKEKVESYLEDTLTIQKVASEVAKEGNITVSDEEARQVKVNYVVFKVESDATDKAKTKAKQQATKLMNHAKDTKSLAQSAKALKLDVNEATYGKNNDQIPQEIVTESMALKKGEITKPIKTDYGYYVIQCMEETDKDATKTAKEELVSEKQMEYYNTTSQKWVSESDVKVDEELWDLIKFENNSTLPKAESTENTTSVESTTGQESTTSAESTTGQESTTSAESTTAQ